MTFVEIETERRPTRVATDFVDDFPEFFSKVSSPFEQFSLLQAHHGAHTGLIQTLLGRCLTRV